MKITIMTDCGVSSKTVDMIIFNMLLLDVKSFFRYPKDHKLTYL